MSVGQAVPEALTGLAGDLNELGGDLRAGAAEARKSAAAADSDEARELFERIASGMEAAAQSIIGSASAALQVSALLAAIVAESKS